MNPFKRFFSPRKNKFWVFIVLCSILVLSFSWGLSDIKLGTKKDDTEQSESQESSFSHGVEIMKKFIQENLDYLKDKKDNMGEMLDEAKIYFDQKWGGKKDRLKSSGFDSSIDEDISKPEDGPMTPEELKKMNPDDLLYPEQIDVHHDDSISGKVLDALNTMKEKLGQGFDSVGGSLNSGKDTIAEKLHKIGETFDQGKEKIKQMIPEKVLPKDEPITINDKQDIDELNQVLPEDLQKTPAGETHQDIKMPGLSDTAGSLGDKLSAAKDTIAGTVSESISKLGEKISSGTESLKGMIHDMPPIGETLQHGKEFISHGVDSIADTVSAGMEKIGLRKKRTQEETSTSEDESTSEGLKGKLREGVDYLKEKKDRVMENIGDIGTDKLSGMTDEIRSKMVDTKEYLRDIKDEMTGELPPEQLSGIKGMAKDKYEGGKEFVKEKLEDIGVITQESTQRMKDIWKQKKAEWIEDVDENLRGSRWQKEELLDRDIGDKIKGKFREGKEYIREKKEDLADTLDSGMDYLKEKKEDLVDAITPDSMGKIKEKYRDTKEFIKEKREDLMDKVDEGVDYLKEKKEDLEEAIYPSTATKMKRTIKKKVGEAEDYIEEKKEDFKDTLEEGYDYLKDKKEDLGEKWDESKEFVKGKFEGAKDVLKDRKEDLGEKWEEGKEFVKEKIGDAKEAVIDKKETIADKVDTGMDYLKEKKEDIVDTLGEGKEFVKEKVGDAKEAWMGKVDSGIDYLKEKKEDLGEKWDESKEFVKDKMGDAKDILIGEKEDLIGKVDSGMDYLKEKKDEFADTMRMPKMDTLKGKYEEGKEYIRDKMDQAKDYVGEKKDDLVDKVEEGIEHLAGKETVEEKISPYHHYKKKEDIMEKIDKGKEHIKEKFKHKKDDILKGHHPHMKDIIQVPGSDHIPREEDLTFKDKVREGVDYLKEKKDDLIDSMTPPGMDTLKDKYEEGKEFVKDKIEGAKEFVQEKKEDLGDVVKPDTVFVLKDKAEDAKDFVKEKKDELLENASIDALKGTVQDSINFIKDKKDLLVGEASLENLKEKVTKGMEAAKEKKDELLENASVEGIKDKISEGVDYVKEKKDQLAENLDLENLSGQIKDKFSEKDPLFELRNFLNQKKENLDWLLGKKDDILGRLVSHGIIKEGGDISDINSMISSKLDDAIRLADTDEKKKQLKEYLKNLQEGFEEVPFGAALMNRLEELGVDFSIFDEKIQKLREMLHHHRHVKLPENELKGKEGYLENIIGHDKDPYDRKEDVLSSITDDSDDIKLMKEEEMDPAHLGKKQIYDRLKQHNLNEDISFWEKSGDESISFVEA